MIIFESELILSSFLNVLSIENLSIINTLYGSVLCNIITEQSIYENQKRTHVSGSAPQLSNNYETSDPAA